MNKNSINKDNNRTTIKSAGNYTNNNSNYLTRFSTSIKLFGRKNIINSNVLCNKMPLNQTFNFSNEFLFKRQQQKEKKENNSYFKNHNHNNTIINNSHNLYYKNFININSNNIFYSYKLKKIKDNSLEYLKTQINNNKICDENKNASNNKLKMDNFYYNYNHRLKNNNNLFRNLKAKNDVMISIKNLFNFFTKNNNTLDVFTVVNKKNIPEELFGIIKTIVRNCNTKKRFIEYILI